MENVLENFDTERFIEEIKNRPPIWDTNSDGYSNRELKKKCWAEVIRIFGGEELSPTKRRYMQITLQRKWKGIRGCFTRELRRQGNVKAGIDPGARKSEYTHFQQMLFLRNVVTRRPRNNECLYYEEPTTSPTNIKQENSNDGENSSSKFDDDIDEDYCQLEDAKSDYGQLEEINVEFDTTDPLRDVKRLKAKKTRYDSMTDDDDLLFLLSMLKTLKKVPMKKKMATRMNIMAVLDEATKDLEV